MGIRIETLDHLCRGILQWRLAVLYCSGGEITATSGTFAKTALGGRPKQTLLILNAGRVSYRFGHRYAKSAVAKRKTMNAKLSSDLRLATQDIFDSASSGGVARLFPPQGTAIKTFLAASVRPSTDDTVRT